MSKRKRWWSEKLRLRIIADTEDGKTPNYEWLSPTLRAKIEADTAQGKGDWVLSEVIAMLQAEGLPVTVAKIRNALLTGRVTRPDMDGAGNMRFSVPNIAEICAYLVNPPRPGRPRKEK